MIHGKGRELHGVALYGGGLTASAAASLLHPIKGAMLLVDLDPML
jgi:hypothetical protein